MNAGFLHIIIMAKERRKLKLRIFSSIFVFKNKLSNLDEPKETERKFFVSPLEVESFAKQKNKIILMSGFDEEKEENRVRFSVECHKTLT